MLLWIIPFTLLLAVIALVALWFSPQRRIRRALRRGRRVSIAEFPPGAPARVVGTVLDGPRLTAPLSGRACVFYDAIVEEYRADDTKRGAWVPIVQESRGVPFMIDDGSGRALVDPDGAKLAVEKDSMTRSGSFDNPTPVETAFLERHAQKGAGPLFNKTLRYREGALEIGETIAVLGLGSREPDPDAVPREMGYRDGPPTRLRLTSSKASPLLISDYAETKR